MSRKIRFLAIAHQDIVEIATYIAQNNLPAALKFVEALKASYQHLANFPDSGEMWENDDSRLSNIRIWPVHKYSN